MHNILRLRKVVAACTMMLIMTNCALLQKRTIDSESWVQLNISEIKFTERMPEGGVAFAKVTVTEEITSIFIIAAINTNMVYVASIIDKGNDGTIDDAFVAGGIYNDEVPPDGFPFTAQNPPIRVNPSEFTKVTQDFNTILSVWKKGKHISLLEMNIVVKALSVPNAVSFGPYKPPTHSNDEPV